MEQSPSLEAVSSSASKQIPKFYGIQMSITVLTIARHLSLFWARWIQSKPSHPTKTERWKIYQSEKKVEATLPVSKK